MTLIHFFLSRKKTKRHILLCLMGFVPLLLHAGEEVSDSEILKKVSIRKIEGKKWIAIDSLLIQINRRKGDNASEFTLPYSKNEKFSIEDAWIEDMQGNIIRKLKNKDITSRSYVTNAALYLDDFVKEFQLRHNVYPYKIFLTYKKTSSDFMYIANWRPFDRLNQPVKQAKLIVEIPNDYEIKYKQEQLEEPEVLTLQNKRIYIWETSYESRIPENFTSHKALKIPGVIVLPLHFKYGVTGSWETWETFGDWLSRLNANTRKLPLSEQQQIDRLLNGVTETREKIKILYQYLQSTTRYINVKINTGGLKTYPAEYVSTNKYGDCKALSNYMISMLEYAGIPAYYTMIRAGDEIEEIDLSFPAQAFNHVIVTVPLEKDTLFLECTNKNYPCGYMGTFTQGRKALVIDKKAYFVQIPHLQNNEVECSAVLNVEMTENLSAVGINMLQRGYLYERYSSISNNWTNADKERYMQNVFQGYFQLENFTIHPVNPDLPEINLSVVLKMQDIYKIYGKDILVNPFSRALPNFEPPEERTQAVQINYPICYSHTNVYVFPQDLKIKPLSKNDYFESKYGTYRMDYRFLDNRLTVVKQMLIFGGIYEIEEYPSFYEFISGVKNNEKRTIHLELEEK